jgi:hypothetical protein
VIQLVESKHLKGVHSQKTGCHFLAHKLNEHSFNKDMSSC